MNAPPPSPIQARKGRAAALTGGQRGKQFGRVT
jgi:hypothetical protein